MRQKQIIMTVLTVVILIIIGFRFAGYSHILPTWLVWGLIAIQFGVSYLWKPTTP